MFFTPSRVLPYQLLMTVAHAAHDGNALLKPQYRHIRVPSCLASLLHDATPAITNGVLSGRCQELLAPLHRHEIFLFTFSAGLRSAARAKDDAIIICA